MKPDVKAYPGAVYDTKAAVQYIRANAGELGIDPERIGMVGDSAGAHLSALVALAGEEPAFFSEYRSDAHVSVPAKVKAVVGLYGVYDMLAQWEHDLLSPNSPISLGIAAVTAEDRILEDYGDAPRRQSWPAPTASRSRIA